MNYLIAILSILVVVLFLFTKNLYNENKQLEENNKLIITAYETSIETLENKAKFEKEIFYQVSVLQWYLKLMLWQLQKKSFSFQNVYQVFQNQI